MQKFVQNIACLVLATTMLAGCAGRKANPVQAIQSNDEQLTCEQIVNTLKLNTVELKGLLKESSSNRGKTAAAGVIGTVIFFPALFFMDTKNAANAEARALVRRNQVLFRRHQIMKCTPALADKNTEEYVIHWEDISATNDKTPRERP